MLFAPTLVHLPAASEVCEILGDALTLSETPIPLKIARLFLASDILHNTSSGVRNATRYRRCAGLVGHSQHCFAQVTMTQTDASSS